MHPLAARFPRIWIVNLPDRRDRRRDTARELARIGLHLEPGHVEFIEASRPDDRGDFPSVGARGCFESHHSIVKRARELGLERVLVLEDDVEFSAAPHDFAELVAQLESREPWDFAYFGHRVDVRAPDPNDRWVRFRRGFDTTHCYALSARVLPTLDAFLDGLRDRPPHHPDGGPMHVDGAYADFRCFHPDTVTLLATPSVAHQRPTASDIHPGRLDSSAVPQPLISAARSIRSRLPRSRWPRSRWKGTGRSISTRR